MLAGSIGLVNSINKAYGSKSSSRARKRKSPGDVMTEENINKMREIAYNDALGGGKYESNSFRSFLFKLRDEVAPDREKLLSGALAQLDTDISNYAFKHGKHPETLLEYILDAEGEFDCGNGSYSAHVAHGTIDMKIYDENGDFVGGYSSNSGFHKFSTPKENSVGIFFSKLYHDTYLEYSNQIKNKTTVSGDFTAASQLDYCI